MGSRKRRIEAVLDTRISAPQRSAMRSGKRSRSIFQRMVIRGLPMGEVAPQSRFFVRTGGVGWMVYDRKRRARL